MTKVNQRAAWLVVPRHALFAQISTFFWISSIVLLSVGTLHIQHSCKPLLEWTDISGQECQAESKDGSRIFDASKDTLSVPESASPIYSQPIQSSNEFYSREPSNSDMQSEHSKNELVEIAAGTAVAVGLAIVGAPVVVAAGIGATVWFAAKALFSSGG